MKKVIFIISNALLFVFICNAQSFEDFPDQYNEDLTGKTFGTYFYEPPDGEYQLVVGQFPWGWDEYQSQYSNDWGPFRLFPKSVKIELVSFPFVPDCLPSCYQQGTTGHSREFLSIPLDVDEFELFELDDGEVVGTGIEYEGFNIFLTTQGYFLSTPNYYEGFPTSLMSLKYVNPCSNDKMLLPHSIFKYTLYIHEEYNLENIIDQVTWIVDNTRGRMKFYPFSDLNHEFIGGTNFYDVSIYPQMHYYENFHVYNSSDNSDWYESPELSLDNGSIDFFPYSDIVNSPYLPPNSTIFYPANPAGTYYTYVDNLPTSLAYIHPAQYCIVNPTIRNYAGQAYAGYNNEGNYPTSVVQNGIEHEYFIQESFSLDLINPDEKIIYNPSVCTVNTTITFPEDYKFLSVHGKPADKSTVDYYKDVYWPERGWNFTDYRDVPVEYPEGIPWTEYYIDDGGEIIIETNVIIMNAEFAGPETGNKGIIRYYPDQTFGNFKISSDLKLVILSDNLVITGSQIWENETDFLGDIIYVENGATLTIKNTLALQPEGKIVVKRGGKLVLDGGTITGNNVWQGIEVWGNANQSQSYTYQGAVEMINGGTIENAVCGISTIRYSIPDGGEQETPDYLYTGGMVLCDGAIFKNNETAVKFWRYTADESNSLFRDCQFITDDDLIAGVNPENFIELDDISGINIAGCSFSDTHTVSSSSPDELTTGIYSYNSQFDIWQYLDQPATFSGLYDGIRAYSVDPAKTVSIINSLFTNNLRSVYLNTVMEATLTGNIFNPWDGTVPEEEESYCLYLDYCTDYTVEENDFSYEGTGPLGIGLVINASGQDDNEVYNNIFTNLQYATLAQGNNRGSDPAVGLQIKCNDYLSNYQDIAVTANVLFLPGIATNQGAESSNTTEQAGNRFSLNNNGNDVSDYITIRPAPINYYHHDPGVYNEQRVLPEDISDHINPENQGTTFDKITSCPDHSASGGGGSGEEELRAQMATSEFKADSTQNILTGLVDGGNTEALEQEVILSMPPETYDLYMSLMGKSPYLSDTVLMTAIEKENVLSNVLIKDILVANPQSAKSNRVMEKVDEKSNPMTQEMLAEVLMGKYIVAAKEKLESQVALHRHNRSRALKFLKQICRNDTINSWAQDSLVSLLESEQGMQEKFELVFEYAKMDNWVVATNLLNNFPGQYSFNAYQQDVYDDFNQLAGVLYEISQSENGLDSITDEQKNILYELADNTRNMAGSYARNILIKTDDYPYQEPIILPEEGYKSGSIAFDLPDIETYTPDNIEIYPNPAKDYIIVELKTGNVNGALLKVFDNQGKPVKDFEIQEKQQHVVIPIKDIQPGFYYLTVELNGKILESKKFSKVN